jgi:hypothetical protein
MAGMDKADIAEINRKRKERLRWVTEHITPEDGMCSKCTALYKDTCLQSTRRSGTVG